MNRGEVWLAQVGRKLRPVLVLTRSGVIDVRASVTVVEMTTSIRGTAAEVAVDHAAIGLDQPTVINCDGIHTVRQSSLTRPIGEVDDETLTAVCDSLAYALGC